MKTFPVEPLVRVGLCENAPFGLHPQGKYSIDASEDMVTYMPLDENAHMLIKGLQIGRGFHWQQCRNMQFEGVIQICKKGDNTLLLNIIKAENYLHSVVGSEMHPDAPEEFIKTHAIISRSWLFRQMMSRPRQLSACNKSYINDTTDRLISWTETDAHKGYDVCPDDHCQRYQGLDAVTTSSKEAVDATRGCVLIGDDGEIADTRYSKCCGGTTEVFSSCWSDTDYSYLRPVDDPYCSPDRLRAALKHSPSLLKEYDAATTDYYDWTVEVPVALIEHNLSKLYGISIGNVEDLQPIKYGTSGRIVELKVTGSKGSVVVGKELAIRKLLSETHLYSSAFRITKLADRFLLHGRGWGHGVGLCQIGAAVMAAEGFNCEQILAHYFPGTVISKLYD